jgi:hypothetical protein
MSIKNQKNVFTYIVLLVVVSLMFSHPAIAATVSPSSVSVTSSGSGVQPQITNLAVDVKNDFIVEPGKIEVDVNPGDVVTRDISVTSRIATSTKFMVTTEDFQGSNSEEQPVILLGDKSSPWSFKDNLVPAVPDFTLNLGDRIDLPITITVPKDASPGGYLAAVIVSNEPQVNTDTSSGASGARIISRIAVLFFIRVAGVASSSGYAEDFRLDNPQAVYTQAPQDFKILFNNTGNMYLVPYGQINITNTFGSSVATIPVNAYFSLPDSLRYLDVSWNDQGHFRMGRYTATLNLNRGYGGIVDTKVITFWILPWNVVGPIVLGIIILGLIIYFIFSKFEFRRRK